MNAQVDLGSPFDFKQFWNIDGSPLNDELRLDSVRYSNGSECDSYLFLYDNCRLSQIKENDEPEFVIEEDDCMWSASYGEEIFDYNQERLASTEYFTTNLAGTYYSIVNQYSFDSLGRLLFYEEEKENLFSFDGSSSINLTYDTLCGVETRKESFRGQTTDWSLDRINEYNEDCQLVSSYTHSITRDLGSESTTDTWSTYTYEQLQSIVRMDTVHYSDGTMGIFRNEITLNENDEALSSLYSEFVNGEWTPIRQVLTEYNESDEVTSLTNLQYRDDEWIAIYQIQHRYNDEGLTQNTFVYSGRDSLELDYKKEWSYNSYGLPVRYTYETDSGIKLTTDYFYAYNNEPGLVDCSGFSPTSNLADTFPFAISPNPSESNFTITNENGFNDSDYFQIYSLDGKLVYSHFFSASEDRYEFGGELQSGTYLAVSYKNGRIIATQKLVKL